MQPGSLQAYAWGEGGNGGTSAHGSHAGGGGGGGALGGETNLGGVTPGSGVLTIAIGTGGTGTNTTITGGSVTITAAFGASTSGQTGASGGAAGSNTVAFAGGAGASGATNASITGAGGGGSAGSTGAGGAGSATGTGGTAGTGAAGPPSLAGAAGAAGAGTTSNGANGITPGSGASGGGSATGTNKTGGTGAPGQVILIWSVITITPQGYAGFTGVAATGKKVTSAVKGYTGFAGALPRIVPVNAWKGTFAQPAAFGTMPPALQSSVIALTPATSVGSGSGYPTAGNWLFAITGMNEQSATAGFTVGDADDIHSFWRPGNVTTSTWAVSQADALTRTSIWYTPNLARQPGDVYVAPSGAFDATSCLVIEVSGLGPWDTVTGIDTSYAAAATSLSLALGMPSAPVFLLAAVTGDLTTAGQSFAPAGWTALTTVTADNGTDHTADCVLTSACLTTGGAVSVSASASSDTDLSGVIIGVLANAPSPVPAGANTAWAGRFIMEAAFNGGFQTPADELQWTVMTDNAWTPGQAIKRLWGFSDQSGVPYMLGQLQSGTGTVPLDNFDGALSPARVGPSGPWSFAVTGTPSTAKYFTVTTAQAASISTGQAFTDVSNPGTLFVVQSVGAPSGGDVNVNFLPAAANVMSGGDVVTQVNPVTGIPVRLRCALGTITTREGSVTYDRWYILQRNALNWPEKRNKALRNFVPLATTDIWSVMSGSCPTPYRGEVEQDAPGWWWPCDDQALTGGVLPTSLRNAAKGSSTVLNIVASPSGVSSQDAYSSGYGAGSGGVDVTSAVQSGANPSVATYAVAQSSGWMYGDPQSSPQSSQSGNPVTAQPGSAAWQQSGLLGDTGAQGWTLIANDNYPALATGLTVAGWWNYAFLGTTASSGLVGGSTYYNVAGQPYAPATLFELATGSAPVAILQLDTSGHLNLITYNGGTGTSHSIYTGSDLRCNAFIRATVLLTSSTYAVYVNGSITASASGPATISATAPTWFIANGDLGSNGGSSTATGLQHGANVQVSHLQIYPGLLPLHRELAHYSAAITGCGLLPAPTGLQASSVASFTAAGSFTEDGTEYQGSYGSGTNGTPFSVSALAVAVAGPVTSGPAARTAAAFRGGVGGSAFGAATFISWTALAPLVQVYTSASADTETEASSVLGSGESYTSGFGSGASGHGAGHVSGGTGASPPTAPSALGDTVAQRIERCLGYGSITAPARAIDSSADLLVQAAGDVGGQAPGPACRTWSTATAGSCTSAPTRRSGTAAARISPVTP